MDEKQASWGRGIDAHVSLLHHTSLLMFQRLVQAGRDDPLFNEAERVGIFYAQSWALVHYLLFANQPRPSLGIQSYLSSVRKGEPLDVAFQQAFGVNYGQMTRQLKTYLREGEYRVVSWPRPTPESFEFSVQRAMQTDVTVACARLALGGKRVDVARKYVNMAARIAPESATTFELLARLEYWNGRWKEAGAAATHAIALGTKDAFTYCVAASVVVMEAGKTGDFRAAADLLEQAIALQPGLKSAYLALAKMLVCVDPLRPEDLQVVADGHRKFFDDGSFALGAALAVEKLHDTEEALRLVRLARTRGLSGSQRSQAAELEARLSAATPGDAAAEQ